MGGVVSRTVTVKLPLAVLLWASVAEQFTVVVPRANVLPEAGEQLTATGPSTRSLADAEYETAAPDGPVASAVIFAGSVRVGGVVSRTVTVKLPLAVLLWASVAEQFTVVVPRANVLPEAGEQLTATGPSTRSLADAEYETAAPDGPVASAVIFAGSVRVGGVVSCTVTVKLPLAVLLWASVAEQFTVVVPRQRAPRGRRAVDRNRPVDEVAGRRGVGDGAPDGPVASAVMFAGSDRVGGVVSCTVTLKLPLAVLLCRIGG